MEETLQGDIYVDLVLALGFARIALTIVTLGASH